MFLISICHRVPGGLCMSDKFQCLQLPVDRRFGDGLARVSLKSCCSLV